MENTPIRILLADDDETDRLIFKDAFEELPAQTIIHTVSNGVQLMNYLSQQSAELPDLLFIDLNMPRKNGLECLQEIRSDSKLKDIAVAIYSTSASEEDIQKTFLAGANVYIKKPGDFSILKKVLEKVILATSFYQRPPFDKSNFFLRI